MNLAERAPERCSLRRNVLLGCYGVPGRGGASTVAYRLYELLRADGLDIQYVTIVDEQDPDFYRFLIGERYGNPRGLPGVESCVLDGPIEGPQPTLVELIRTLSPDVMIGFGTNSATVMRPAFPERPLVLLTTGSQQMIELVSRGEVRDFITQREILARSPGRPTVHREDEQGAVRVADLVVTHAEIIEFLYRSYYWDQDGKIWPEVISFGEWIFEDAAPYAHLARPFEERDIDVLFIASYWTRPEKNYALVRQIVPAFAGARVHIVGEVETRCPGAIHHGFIVDRTRLFGLLGRARTVVSTSAIDAAPGILFEASAMGCNIVASPNCGNWQLCHPDLLVPRADLPGFVSAIRASLTRKYDDRADLFRDRAPTQRLIDILQVV